MRSALIAIAVGACLRLYGLGAMEFKWDEQEALNQSIRLLEDRLWASWRTWPTHGLLSSNGVANAPLFTWLVAVAWLIARGAVGVTVVVALVNVLCLYPLWLWARRRMDDYRALLTLALCAVSPFAVIFSRKIWTQDLLLPGVVCVLWGIEWLRGDRIWRGIVLLLTAALVAGQLHQSGPIALALLPLALGLQAAIDRYRGEGRLRLARPSSGEWAALGIVLGLNLMFWLPYLDYFMRLPAETFANRPRVDQAWPYLFERVGSQVIPFDLFYFFEPHRQDFLRSPLRWFFYTASVWLGAPLFVYGAWRWLRSPWSLPVLGFWWALIIAAFAAARIPSYPFYVLILAPLPAVLAAGGFDAPWRHASMSRVRDVWRAAYVVVLVGLTVTMEAWLVERGGAAGDYGVGYARREAQARALVNQIGGGGTENYFRLGGLRPSEPIAALSCAPVPDEVHWIARHLAESTPWNRPQLANLRRLGR